MAATHAALERAMADDVDVKLQVRLSPLATGILHAKQQRTGKTKGEVLDQLLRSMPLEE